LESNPVVFELDTAPLFSLVHLPAEDGMDAGFAVGRGTDVVRIDMAGTEQWSFVPLDEGEQLIGASVGPLVGTDVLVTAAPAYMARVGPDGTPIWEKSKYAEGSTIARALGPAQIAVSVYDQQKQLTELHALDQDGQLVWTQPQDSPFDIAGGDGRIVMARRFDGWGVELIELDPGNGEPMWTIQHESPYCPAGSGSLALLASGRILYTGVEEHEYCEYVCPHMFVAVFSADGELLEWHRTTQLGDKARVAAVGPNGRTYLSSIGNDVGRIVEIDDDGLPVWQLGGQAPDSSARFTFAADGTVYAAWNWGIRGYSPPSG
jgi:outer membrane protein assembly factor BamB